MNSLNFDLHLWWRVLVLTSLLFANTSLELNTDGVVLLSFKYSMLTDPLGVLSNWNFDQETPCSWNGVTCASPNISNAYSSRIIKLSLPNSQLLGSISADLGMLHNLQTLDLSNNSINGAIPLSIYSVSSLRVLDLSNNLISGEISELVGGLTSLESLRLSENAISGKIPENLTSLPNLQIVSLKSNYLTGNIPGGFDSVQVLDLSSNLINDSLPTNFGSSNLQYLNLSYNRLSGEIPPQFVDKFPTNVTLDLSFNNFTGAIPESTVFTDQDAKVFNGNPELCGKPLRNLCPIPSTMTNMPNETAPDSPPAIAVLPNTIPSINGTQPKSEKGMKATTVIAIVVGDVVGVALIALIVICVYRAKKRKTAKREAEAARDYDWGSASTASSDENKWLRSWACLLNRRNGEDDSSSGSSSSSERGENNENLFDKSSQYRQQQEVVNKGSGSLVSVDGGEKELELETLLKASAYILGATGSSIMYKAVLEDGTALAVRRIGESGVERFRDFENQVRVIARLVHPNLVRIRGFYWGTDEKLVIYDFVPNGNLANTRYRKVGSSPISLPWEVRLKIAKGMARGLAYIHDKKHVHGNLKPTNILLGADMEPKIGDFGLERLVTGDNSCKASASARNFGSKRSTTSRDSFQDVASLATPSPSSLGCSPYYAPESLRSLKPTAKWDVYSFGVVLLELLTGKVIISDELGPNAIIGDATLAEEDKGKVLRMADMAIRAELEGKEESLLALLRLGYSCISPVPQKRPSMKEALQILDKFPSSTPSSYIYGH